MVSIYTLKQLKEMDQDSIYGTIRIGNFPDSLDQKYYLYAGKSTSYNGRPHIALPVELKITEEIAKKYDIWKL